MREAWNAQGEMCAARHELDEFVARCWPSTPTRTVVVSASGSASVVRVEAGDARHHPPRAPARGAFFFDRGLANGGRRFSLLWSSMGVQQVLRNASALVVDDHATLRHAVDCDMRAELSEVLRQSNGSVIRREGASTLVRTHDVPRTRVERMRAVGCVRGHEWYPLRVRLPRGGGGRACTDPYLRLQPHLVDDGVVAA